MCLDQYAGCALDHDNYIEGSFPGARKLMVSTSGAATIRVALFLEQKLSPGTELEITWFEPGCAEQHRYQLTKAPSPGDLFEKAGPDSVFSVERAVADAGDHLVQIFSDATCGYLLKIDVL